MDCIDMISPYKPVFLLPLGTDKRLGDCAWEFHSKKRLPRTLLLSLTHILHLNKKEIYLGMEVYEGEGIKMTAITDARGIEHIFFQIWSRRTEDIERALARDGVEAFSPGD